MGDRCNVDLTIRKADELKFEALCNDFNDKYVDNTSLREGVETIDYTFYEVNYGNLEIEQELIQQKIPYDKTWSQGGDYDGGTEYHRIDADGESIVKEFIEGTEGMVHLKDLEKAFEMNCVDTFIQDMKNEVYIISWKDQDAILNVMEKNQ